MAHVAMWATNAFVPHTVIWAAPLISVALLTVRPRKFRRPWAARWCFGRKFDTRAAKLLSPKSSLCFVLWCFGPFPYRGDGKYCRPCSVLKKKKLRFLCAAYSNLISICNVAPTFAYKYVACFGVHFIVQTHLPKNTNRHIYCSKKAENIWNIQLVQCWKLQCLAYIHMKLAFKLASIHPQHIYHMPAKLAFNYICLRLDFWKMKTIPSIHSLLPYALSIISYEDSSSSKVLLQNHKEEQELEKWILIVTKKQNKTTKISG